MVWICIIYYLASANRRIIEHSGIEVVYLLTHNRCAIITMTGYFEERMLSMKILDFGSCNIDYVYSVKHIVRPGETQAATTLRGSPVERG